MSEPIHDGGELDEAEEGAGELVVTSADAALGFDAAKEVLNLMTSPVVTAMEAGRMPPVAFLGDAATGPLGAQAGAKDVGVKTLVGHDPAVAHIGQHRKHGVLVVLLTGGETDRQGPTPGIDDRRALGVQATFGPAHRLRGLAAPRIGPVLMQFDVGEIQVDGITLVRTLRHMKPGLHIIAMSGLHEQNRIKEFASLQITHFRQKPFSIEQLSEALKGCLGPDLEQSELKLSP